MTEPKHSNAASHDRLHDARDAAANVYEQAKDKAGAAYNQSRAAARRAGEGLEANPLGLIAGGVAVGALVGALLPRSEREKDLLAPLGRQLNERARGAIKAAREAGLEELDARGLSKHAARDQVRSLIDGAVTAASKAGTAAARTAADRA